MPSRCAESRRASRKHFVRVELTATRMVAGGDALAPRRRRPGRPDRRRPSGRTGPHRGHRRPRRTISAGRVRRGARGLARAGRRRRASTRARAAAAAAGSTSRPTTQPQLKLDIIRDALNRIAHVADPPLAEPVLLPTEGFRTTVRALVVDGKPAFREHQSHDPVLIDSCLVAHPAIDELLRDGHFGARERGDAAGRRRHRRTRRARRSRRHRHRPPARRHARQERAWCTR